MEMLRGSFQKVRKLVPDYIYLKNKTMSMLKIESLLQLPFKALKIKTFALKMFSTSLQ
jgi:hypothetical protein